MAEQEYIYHWVREAGKDPAAWLGEGRIREIEVAGEMLCVLRRGAGFLAFRRRCPHANAPLSNARLNENGDLICPWHRFAFCPATGKNTSGEGYFLQTYPTEIREMGLFVGLPVYKRFLGIF